MPILQMSKLSPGEETAWGGSTASQWRSPDAAQGITLKCPRRPRRLASRSAAARLPGPLFTPAAPYPGPPSVHCPLSPGNLAPGRPRTEPGPWGRRVGLAESGVLLPRFPGCREVLGSILSVPSPGNLSCLVRLTVKRRRTVLAAARCVWRGVSWRAVSWRAVSWRGCPGGDLEGAVLEGGVLGGCPGEGGVLERGVLEGGDLEGGVLDGGVLERGVRSIQATQCREGRPLPAASGPVGPQTELPLWTRGHFPLGAAALSPRQPCPWGPGQLPWQPLVSLQPPATWREPALASVAHSPASRPRRCGVACTLEN